MFSNILQQIGQVLYRWWRPDVEEHSLDDLTNLANGESKRISLQCSIESTLVYVGLNSDGILTSLTDRRGEYLYQSMVCLLAVR